MNERNLYILSAAVSISGICFLYVILCNVSVAKAGVSVLACTDGNILVEGQVKSVGGNRIFLVVQNEVAVFFDAEKMDYDLKSGDNVTVIGSMVDDHLISANSIEVEER
jgi:hypothetical protein